MKNQQKTLLLWIVLILMFAAIAKFTSEGRQVHKPITYPDFVTAIENKNVEKVVIKGEKKILGKFKSTYENGSWFETTGPKDDAVTYGVVTKHGIIPEFEEEDKDNVFTTFLIHWGPMIFLFVIVIFFLKQLQAGGGKAMSFGKSKARMLSPHDKKNYF